MRLIKIIKQIDINTLDLINYHVFLVSSFYLNSGTPLNFILFP
jgi:hypothetical protein